MGFLFLLTVSLACAAVTAMGYYFPYGDNLPFWQGAVGLVSTLVAGVLVAAALLHLLNREKQLAEKYSRSLELLVEQGSTAILLLDREMRISYCNSRCLEMMQLEEGPFPRRFDIGHYGKYIPKKTFKRIGKAVEQGKAWKGELRFPLGGEDKHALVTISPLVDKKGLWEQLLISSEDISEHKAIADRLFIQEHYSVLTGLPNRDLALKKLSQSIDSSTQSSEHLVVAHIDIDRIRYLNDSLGHQVVDGLLNAIAERMGSWVGDDQVLAHLGADEFLLLCSDGCSLDEGISQAQGIVEILRQPFYIDNHEINISASIGLTQFPEDGRDALSLLRSAEAAMYAAKEEGGNRYCLFDQTMSSRVEHRLETENHLRHAIERNEFLLHYQPIIDLATSQLVGAEVLLRWRNDELRNPSPANFIHIAEDSGLIVPIGDWVLKEACKQAVKWREQGLPPLRIAVNISARQFHENHITSSVRQALTDSGLAADQLELEITEGLLINDAPNIRQCFDQLKSLGVRLAIDDFGTGYASMSYLKRYPFDILKIDRSFVHDVATSEESVTLVNAIIAMAHSFGMEVVAEGVETLQQRRILQERRCDKVQGFLYSPAIAADHFASWAKRYHDIQLAQYV